MSSFPPSLLQGQRDTTMTEEDDLFRNVTSAALELIGDLPHPLPQVSNVRTAYPLFVLTIQPVML